MLSFQILGYKFWCHADQFVWKTFVGSSFESMQFFWLVSTSFSGFVHLTCSLQPSGGAFSQSSGLWLGRSWWGYHGGCPSQTCGEGRAVSLETSRRAGTWAELLSLKVQQGLVIQTGRTVAGEKGWPRAIEILGCCNVSVRKTEWGRWPSRGDGDTGKPQRGGVD